MSGGLSDCLLAFLFFFSCLIGLMCNNLTQNLFLFMNSLMHGAFMHWIGAYYDMYTHVDIYMYMCFHTCREKT